MLAGSHVTIVVPAHDEEERLGRVLDTLPEWVDAVFVVDDASRDATQNVALARAEHDARIEVVTHEENRGVGAAIVTGYERALARPGASNDAFVVMAGDGQMDPADLQHVVRPVAEGRAGYVKGDRFRHPDVWRAMPLGRRLGGEVFSVLTSLAVGERVRDTQCGYTVLARWAAERLDLRVLWPRYGYPNDLLGQLTARRIPITEVCVRPVYAGEKSGLRVWHCVQIARIVGRAWVARRAAGATEARSFSSRAPAR